MYFLIKSLKWTENDGVETWWKPKENGYTAYICNAGIYTEEDKEEPHFKAEEGKSLLFVPLTEELIRKATQQVESRLNKEKLWMKSLKKSYENSIEDAEREIELIKEMKTKVSKMNNMICNYTISQVNPDIKFEK